LLFTSDVNLPKSHLHNKDLDPISKFFNGSTSSLRRSKVSSIKLQLSPRKLCDPTTRAHSSLFTSLQFHRETRSPTNDAPQNPSSDIPFEPGSPRGARRLHRMTFMQTRCTARSRSASQTRELSDGDTSEEGKVDVSAPRSKQTPTDKDAPLPVISSQLALSPHHPFPVSLSSSSRICSFKVEFSPS